MEVASSLKRFDGHNIKFSHLSQRTGHREASQLPDDRGVSLDKRHKL